MKENMNAVGLTPPQAPKVYASHSAMPGAEIKRNGREVIGDAQLAPKHGMATDWPVTLMIAAFYHGPTRTGEP